MMLTNIFCVSWCSSVCLSPSVVSLLILRRGSLAVPARAAAAACHPWTRLVPVGSLLPQTTRDNQACVSPVGSAYPRRGSFGQAALGMAAGLSDALPLVPHGQSLLTVTSGSYSIDPTQPISQNTKQWG